MKTTISLTLLTITMITVTAFALRHSVDAKEKIGLQVITALQRSSLHEFSAMFPTVADFHGLMMRNSELYGVNLNEAAREFEKEFAYVLFPEFKKSFERIIHEGKEAGIDWRTAQFVSVEVPEEIESDFAAVPMTINFRAQGKEHRLKIEKALVIDGHWKLSQYISLEK